MENVVDADVEKEQSSNLASWVNESAIPQHREYRKNVSLGMVSCKILLWAWRDLDSMNPEIW